MEYKQLNDAQQRQMLEQRQINLEQEHFNHTVNLQLLEASGDDSASTTQAIKDTKTAIATIESAHDEVTQLITDIIEESPPAPDGGTTTGPDGEPVPEPPEPSLNMVQQRRSARRAATKAGTTTLPEAPPITGP